MESTGALLKRNADKVIRLWEERASKEIQSAFGKPPLLLRNSLPIVINQLAAALEPAEPRTPFEIANDVAERLRTAEEHGTERAGMEGYTLAEVILEFHILRQVIFEVLEEIEPIPKRERDIIINAFEKTVNNSASKFAEIQLKNQEQFSQTLVHDFRTPLNAIKVGTYVLSKTQASDILKIPGVLDRIVRNASRLEAMIRELLDVGLIKSGKRFILNPKEMRLDEFLKLTVKQLIEAYGERFEVRAEEEIVGCWDSEGLRRIIENLAINALKYGSPDAPVVIAGKKNDGNATLIVHNEGNPISPKNQAVIFDTYVRSAKGATATGWGLGLAFVKGMAEAHNGTVRVQSSEASGTDFIVELPRMYSSATMQCIESNAEKDMQS